MDKIAFIIKNAIAEQPMDDFIEETLDKLFGETHLDSTISVDNLFRRAEQKIAATKLLSSFVLAKDLTRSAEAKYQYLQDLEELNENVEEYYEKKSELSANLVRAIKIDTRIALRDYFENYVRDLKSNSAFLREVLSNPQDYPGINRLIDIDKTKENLKSLIS